MAFDFLVKLRLSDVLRSAIEFYRNRELLRRRRHEVVDQIHEIENHFRNLAFRYRELPSDRLEESRRRLQDEHVALFSKFDDVLTPSQADRLRATIISARVFYEYVLGLDKERERLLSDYRLRQNLMKINPYGPHKLRWNTFEDYLEVALGIGPSIGLVSGVDFLNHMSEVCREDINRIIEIREEVSQGR